AYIGRHSQVAGIVYRNICVEFRLEVLKSKWETPPKVIENGRTKILWDFKFQANKQVANQPDMVVVNKEQKRAVVIDVAIPSDGNIRKKEHEKLEIPRAEGRIGSNVEGEVHSGSSSNRNTRGCDPPGKVTPAVSRNNI
ncbi:hypothetical protein LDENG_00161950, partial [Lucifuga dentata]